MSRIQKQISVESLSSAALSEPARPDLRLRGGMIRSVLDLLQALDEVDHLPVLGRRVLKANIRTAGFVATRAKARKEGRSVSASREDALLATVPIDPRWLNEHLFAYAAQLCGTSEQNRHLSISGLRRAMRFFDLLDLYMPSTSLPKESVWRALLDQLEHAYADTALATFAAWCDREGIQPHSVTPHSLETFENWLWTRTLHSEIPRLIRNVCKAWPKATPFICQPGGTALTPPARQETYVLPLAAYSTALQADVDEFLQWFAGSDRKGPFTRKERRRKPRPNTVKIRLYQIRQALVALVLLKRQTVESVRLADLINQASCEKILEFHWERALVRRVGKTSAEIDECDSSLGVTTQTAGIAATLIIIARYLGCDQTFIKDLQAMAQDVTPENQYQLSRKSRQRLRQFEDPVTRAKLLHLPRRLGDLIDGGSFRPLEAARLARTAAAIDLLLHIPVRNGNLCMLRLGVHLRYDGSDYVRHLVLQEAETKNRYEGEWPIADDLASTLDWYIKKHRPLLADPENDHLFPAGFGQPGSISAVAMYQSIVRAVAEHVGALLNPHLFRCICAALILEETPEALEDVRLMLGDKSLQTILAHYASSQPRHAAKRWYALLRKLRANSFFPGDKPPPPSRRRRR